MSMIKTIVYSVMDATYGSIKNVLALLRNDINYYRKKGKMNLGIVSHVETGLDKFNICVH